MKRYIYLKKKEGKSFKEGHHFLACNEKELREFQDWRDSKKKSAMKYEFLSPPVRRYIHDEMHDNIDAVNYMGEGWISLTRRDFEQYNNWLQIQQCKYLNED